MREQKEDSTTRKRILDYSVEKFLRYGYSAITIDEIASELRISKATFYRFFGSKEELAEESVRRYFQRIKEFQFGAVDTSKQFLEAFQSIVRMLVERLEQVDPRARWDIRTSIPKTWLKVQILQHEAVNALMERLLSEGVEKGVLRADLKIKIVARLLSLSAESIIHGEAVLSLKMSSLETLNSFVDVLSLGIFAVPKAAEAV